VSSPRPRCRSLAGVSCPISTGAAGTVTTASRLRHPTRGPATCHPYDPGGDQATTPRMTSVGCGTRSSSLAAVRGKRERSLRPSARYAPRARSATPICRLIPHGRGRRPCRPQGRRRHAPGGRWSASTPTGSRERTKADALRTRKGARGQADQPPGRYGPRFRAPRAGRCRLAAGPPTGREPGHAQSRICGAQATRSRSLLVEAEAMGRWRFLGDEPRLVDRRLICPSARSASTSVSRRVRLAIVRDVPAGRRRSRSRARRPAAERRSRRSGCRVGRAAAGGGR
jgi:hypothetical protein